MDRLFEKIKKIEALIVGGGTEGEKSAAISAKNRLLLRYPELDLQKERTEYSLRTPDTWHRKLLMAICRKYGVKPYRYKGQKYTTVMVKINKEFFNEVVWPEYKEYSELLENLVETITDDLIDKIHNHKGEEVIAGSVK